MNRKQDGRKPTDRGYPAQIQRSSESKQSTRCTTTVEQITGGCNSTGNVKNGALFVNKECLYRDAGSPTAGDHVT